MRNLTLYFLTLTLSALTLSCKKEKGEENASSPGKFSFNETELTVDKAYLQIYGADSSSSDNGGRIVIILLTSGLEAKVNSFGHLDISGHGYEIMFETISSSEDELSEGVYKLDQMDKPSFSYNFAMAEPNGNFVSKGEFIMVNGAGGDLVVSGGGSNYDLYGTFAGVGMSTFEPRTFSVSYKGDFEIIDER